MFLPLKLPLYMSCPSNLPDIKKPSDKPPQPAKRSPNFFFFDLLQSIRNDEFFIFNYQIKVKMSQEDSPFFQTAQVGTGGLGV